MVAAALLAVCGRPAEADNLPLIPYPQTVLATGRTAQFASQHGICCQSPELKRAAQAFSAEYTTVFHRPLPIVNSAKQCAVRLRLDSTLREEEYILSSGPTTDIRAGSAIAAAWAESALLQLLKSKDLKHDPQVSIAQIQDNPRYLFRGALIDTARKYHSPSGIKQVIQLCWMYRVRFLQLHLTDDQLFMFPSTAVPSAGKSNHEFARFEPASAPHISPYTREELKDLDQYAADHGVALVPEIDMPGHSGRLIADAPELFRIPGNGATINIAKPQAIEAIKSLLAEVMDTFRSSPVVHIGADEVSLDGLEKTPEYIALKNQDPAITPHDLYCRFVSDIQRFVRSKGKRTAVWEEAFDPQSRFPLERDTLVMSWSQGRDPNTIAASGFKVVNAGWTPLYIVRDNRKTPEFLFAWKPEQFGREASEQFTPFKPGASGGDGMQAGVELCSWENSESIEIQSLRQRLAIAAERGWSGASPGSFAEFSARFASTDALLEKLVNRVHIQTLGGGSRGENRFTEALKVTLSADVPGMEIRYTTDNSLPGSTWKRYTGSFELDKTSFLRAGLFDKTGQLVGPMCGEWLKSEILPKPNLATNRPVTVGPSPDRKDGWFARLAVDGKRDDPMAHWAPEGPAPQWIVVDLQKEQPINTITVVTYWDGGRYYQWNAEASLDGKSWKTVADFSQNTAIATEAGYTAVFAPTRARFVRINMLKNSANPFVHIVELIVDLKKNN
jgi:hexosaminidase